MSIRSVRVTLVEGTFKRISPIRGIKLELDTNGNFIRNKRNIKLYMSNNIIYEIIIS